MPRPQSEYGSVSYNWCYLTLINLPCPTAAKELWEGLLWELLYADDLILVAESEESLHGKIVKWKHSMERKA